LLDPIGGSVVLDMCAAPGMKTTHVAAKLQNYGYAVCFPIRFARLDYMKYGNYKKCIKYLIFIFY